MGVYENYKKRNGDWESFADELKCEDCRYSGAGFCNAPTWLTRLCQACDAPIVIPSDVIAPGECPKWLKKVDKAFRELD